MIGENDFKIQPYEIVKWQDTTVVSLPERDITVLFYECVFTWCDNSTFLPLPAIGFVLAVTP